MKRFVLNFASTAMLAAALAFAQGPPPAQPPGGPQPQGPPQAAEPPAHRARPVRIPQTPPPALQARRPPLERALGEPRGRWWNRPDMVEKLGLTSDQVKRMDDIFLLNRLKLIDLNANVQKEEVIMEPLVAADQPDESKILAQIDRVAQARAELEKANARFLLGIRHVLNADQWKKLQEDQPRRVEPARLAPPPGR